MHLYLRYIEDEFFIWTCPENELQQFILKINETHPSIKFDFNYSKTQMHFLDITIENMYRKTSNNIIKKRNQPAIVSSSKIKTP